jgi:hypothetical protein
MTTLDTKKGVMNSPSPVHRMMHHPSAHNPQKHTHTYKTSSHVFLSVNEELGRQYQGAKISTLKGQFLYNNSRASGHQDFIQNFTLYAYPVILLLGWLVRQDIKQWKGCRECLLQKILKPCQDSSSLL